MPGPCEHRMQMAVYEVAGSEGKETGWDENDRKGNFASFWKWNLCDL